MTLPVQAMTAKELSLKGSFRFHHEYPLAVEMMQRGRLDVAPLITQTFGSGQPWVFTYDIRNPDQVRALGELEIELPVLEQSGAEG